MVFAYQNADASHFRYSSIKWVRDANTNKVNFTVTYAFRYAYGSDGFTYFFGDGSSIYLSTNDPTVATKIGESLVNNNPNDNNSIVIYKFTFSHTYAATGPYTSYFSSCCRISNLQNGGDDYMKLSSKVSLENSNLYSPLINAPTRIFMRQGTTNQLQLTASDPQGDVLTFSMANINGDGTTGNIATTPTAGGNAASISSTGTLSWNTSGTTVGQLYAGRVKVTESRSQSASELDFIIEIVSAATPICTVLGDYDNEVLVGQNFAMSITGSHPNMASVTPVNVPAGMTSTNNGNLQNYQINYSWTPTATQVGKTIVETHFTTTAGVENHCEYQVRVVQSCTSLIATVNTQTSACGLANGSASIGSISGGNQPYLYQWISGGSFTSSSSVSGLSAGNYTLQIKDNNGCLKSVPYTIGNTNVTINASVITTNAYCMLSNGGASITSLSGGVAPYTYKWTNTGTYTSSNSISTLPAGSYTLTVKDNNSCTTTVPYVVGSTQPNITTTISPIVPSTCSQSNGKAFANVTGGLSPYNYKWTATSAYTLLDSNIALLAGTNNLIVKDANGCLDTTSYTVPDITPVPDFTYTIQDNKVTFTNTSTNFTDIFWNFNSSMSSQQTSSSQPPVTITYPKGGTYKVTLIAFYGSGCSKTITKDIVIAPCDATVLITTPMTVNNGTLQKVQSSGTITEQSSIPAGSNVILDAKNSICLGVGTTIESGSVFQTSLVGCNY